MASTSLSRTPASTTNRKTWTWSGWVKRSTLGASQDLFNAYNPSGFWERFYFTSGDILEYDNDIAGTDYTLNSEMLFRDTSAWYHLVFAKDTTQSTEADRLKIYVNGSQITLTEVALGYPPQNTDGDINNGSFVHSIGKLDSGAYFDGSMAHVHFTDGTAYAASTFGETDATTGIWKPKTNPSVTYGTNGFFLKFENSGSMGTDSSGNANNLTVNGTPTQTIDTPSNVFATMNPLVPFASSINFSNGNNTVTDNGSASSWSTRYNVSTLGMSSGKYYAEAKVSDIGTNQMYAIALLQNVGTIIPSSSVGIHGVGYFSTGSIYRGSASQTGLATYTTGDIIGLAFDATNGTAQWYKNGSAVGNPETGLSTDGFWHFTSNFYTTASIDINFGNGYFGTTAVSSAQNPDDGIGIFEYSVPTGYRALCTKSINAQEYS